MDTKELVWLGNSLKDLKSMPLEVRKNAGYQLSRVQSDLAPIDWKPMSSIGLGVREIRIKYKGQYRVIYVTSKNNKVYVLHSFIKKTQKTNKQDIDTVKDRLKLIR